MDGQNASWHLEDFVDSLVVELDKARETLAVKAINKPLSYTVKDLSLDLNIFPSYDGDKVTFLTAQPGQTGASKVMIQLGSITDQQVRATSKPPPARSDINIDDIPVDDATRKQLRKIGVSSVGDLQQIEQKNVDLKKVSNSSIDYSALANQIQKARRNQNPPQISGISMSMDDASGPCLLIKGRHLSVDPTFEPVAVINQNLAEVMSRSDTEMKVRIDRTHAFGRRNDLILTFDPFAFVRVNVKA
ncbi:hypothetical protein AWB81_07016 [Caballeronia arationis]|uniref:hypothetical protein n=1 Tax=Caballeronia arationis TaxID=1777142 RepID=UPI00074C89B6|nr:hypothetical protein [Caballeronia arationis]SAL05096.1 hypothetical protein AWB81_07016 [Caballeronia arationis]